ncbi:MAG: PhzF family phenazine biosynthesis protein [Tissierellia bacterium]|nr:PhzF family phenazine biosynthesis protein [Tissierellia bacterium]
MVRYYTMYLVSAFSNKPFMGNATGVVIDSGNLSDDEMQNIAKDINQSEIVFVRKLDTGRYNTRFFTPHQEIKLCGHATIATFYALAEKEYIIPLESGVNEIIQHTKTGKVRVALEYEDYRIKQVYMYLDVKREEYSIKDQEILEALGLREEDIGLSMCGARPQKISTGLSDIVVPVKNRDILAKINLKEDLAYRLSEKEDIISLHAFTTEDGKNIRQRTFSPRIHVREETGSGTSTAATMYYLYTNDCIRSLEIQSVQGDLLNRPSIVTANYNEEKKRVRVGGRAYVFMNGVLNI